MKNFKKKHILFLWTGRLHFSHACRNFCDKVKAFRQKSEERSMTLFCIKLLHWSGIFQFSQTCKELFDRSWKKIPRSSNKVQIWFSWQIDCGFHITVETFLAVSHFFCQKSEDGPWHSFSSNLSTGHVECSFSNPTENFLTEVEKGFRAENFLYLVHPDR